MKTNNYKLKKDSPNLKFYKKIKENNLVKDFDLLYQFKGLEAFDVYKINSTNFSGVYLTLGNNDSKNIDIYKINSIDDIKLIHTIKVDFKEIDIIKYYYDSYNDCHYLKVLINERTKILIYKIVNEDKYDLIFIHRKKGGYSPLRGHYISFFQTELFFNKEKSFLIVFYISGGCTCNTEYFDIFDFIKNEKYSLKQYCEDKNVELYAEFIHDIYIVKRGDKNYMGFFKNEAFYLYNLSLSNLISVSDKNFYEKRKENADVEKITIIQKVNDIIPGEKTGLLIQESNGEKYLYIQSLHFTNKIYKVNIENNQIIYKAEIKTPKIISMLHWNDKYLLLFGGKDILLFNMKTGRVENKFKHDGNNLYNGKKIIINNNEELLFATDLQGSIYLWINSQK